MNKTEKMKSIARKWVKFVIIPFVLFFFFNFITGMEIFGQWAFYLAFFLPSILVFSIMIFVLWKEECKVIELTGLFISSVVGVYCGLVQEVSFRLKIPLYDLLFSSDLANNYKVGPAEDFAVINAWLFPSQLILFILLMLFYKYIKSMLPEDSGL